MKKVIEKVVVDYWYWDPSTLQRLGDLDKPTQDYWRTRIMSIMSNAGVDVRDEEARHKVYRKLFGKTRLWELTRGEAMALVNVMTQTPNAVRRYVESELGDE